MNINDMLRELDALELLATPGPWKAGVPDERVDCHEAHEHNAQCKTRVVGWHEHSDTDDADYYWSHSISAVPITLLETLVGKYDLVAGHWGYEGGGIRKPKDVALIVAMRNAMPYLLAELKRLRAREAEFDQDPPLWGQRLTDRVVDLEIASGIAAAALAKIMKGKASK